MGPTNLNQITDEPKVRAEICEIGSRLWKRGHIAAFDGNISVCLGVDRILCTPSGISKGFLKPDDLVVIDRKGVKLEGSREPSSEILMHLKIYRSLPMAQAVVHAHPPHATAFAISGHEVPSGIMPEIDILLGRVPLLPFRMPGTAELADSFDPWLTGEPARAFLMSNHGATTWGQSLEQAWHRLESLDQCCQILIGAKTLGTWKSYK